MTTISRSKVRGQIRGFALIWIGITFVMSAITFFAIYLTYGGGPENGNSLTGNVAIPLTTNTAIVAVPTNTATAQVTATSQPATATVAEQQVVAAEPTMTLTPTVVPTPLPVDQKQFAVGIQVQNVLDGNADLQRGWMGLVDQLHIDWIKQQVRWEEMEPVKGEYNFGILDVVLPVAAESHKKVMLSIVTAPEWAREPGIDTSRHGPPANSQDYVNFVLAILDRYPGEVHAIEVWNEQNLSREWTSTRGLKAANYVELLRATYQAVKQVDPGIIVISGALSPTGVSDGIGAWDDFTYMDQLIEAGMLNYVDCVGAHHNGYNIGPSVAWDSVTNDPSASFRGPFDNPHHSWSFRSTLQTYARKVQLAGGDQKLCVTEFGWAVTEDLSGSPEGFGFANDNTLEEQATWTAEALQNMEDWDIVWLAFIWNLNYSVQAGFSPDNDNVPYSFLGPDQVNGFYPRPVFQSVQEWVAGYKERTGQQ